MCQKQLHIEGPRQKGIKVLRPAALIKHNTYCYMNWNEILNSSSGMVHIGKKQDFLVIWDTHTSGCQLIHIETRAGILLEGRKRAHPDKTGSVLNK